MSGLTVSTKSITNIDDPRLVKALAHPLRVRILAMLHEQQLSPVQLSARLDARLGTVAYHVRTLDTLGMVEEVATRQRRGAIEHFYRAKERPRVSDAAWEHAAPMAKQALIGATLQQINDQATLSAAHGGFDRRDAHITRTVMDLDAKGWEQLSTALARLLKDAARIEAAAKRRCAAHPHDESIARAGLVLMHFEASRLSDQRPSRGEAGARPQRAPRTRASAEQS
ncbi:MAG: transcriptional regulator, ArsR family [Solirubrobacterales bacterium]|nr:transcriptional regulator, ArsR family [Solirubrobacterales bacterium]